MKNSIVIILASLLFVGCSDHQVGEGLHGEIGLALPPRSLEGNTSGTQAGPTTDVSGGPNTLGVTAPTAEAAVSRIANGFEGRAPATQGNFRTALQNVKTNLPKLTNVNNAAGYDQIQLLAYAACADLTTGGTPVMQSVYGVQPSATIAANQTALVNAGVRILDQHAAGLASQGPGAAQVNTVLTSLVQAQAAGAGNTSKMAFMAVCIAATTAGTALLGM